jgi:hypothetical protein
MVLHTLDVSALSAGLYTIRLVGEGVQASSRLVVQ